MKNMDRKVLIALVMVTVAVIAMIIGCGIDAANGEDGRRDFSHKPLVQQPPINDPRSTPNSLGYREHLLLMDLDEVSPKFRENRRWTLTQAALLCSDTHAATLGDMSPQEVASRMVSRMDKFPLTAGQLEQFTVLVYEHRCPRYVP